MLYTSKQYLQNAMGVEAEIAAFFVDRNVPAQNMYWKDKYLYVAKGTGFLFIPLFYDLMYRVGLTKDIVLDEDFVRLTENILHSAALHEYELIGFDEHLNNCRELLANKVVNLNLYTDLLQYFGNDSLPYNYLGTFSKALNRGDTYLFALCSLNIPLHLTHKIVELWYILVPSFLLMDDIMDLEKDRIKNEENSINDFGSKERGVSNAISFLADRFAKLKGVNGKLGAYFEGSLQRKLETPYLKSLLNH